MLRFCCHICVAVFAVLVAVPTIGPQFLHNPKVSVDVSGNMDGQVVVVTGGSSGIGREVSQLLAKRGAGVFVTGRTLERAQAAAPAGGDGYELDLSDFAAVRRFATNLTDRLGGRNLDVLILNAGMAYAEFRGPFTTQEGHDTLIASNHLGHFLLVRQLRPLIERSKTRIVVVASIAHWLADKSMAVFSGPPVAKEGEAVPFTTGFHVYGASKFMNVVFTYKLQRDLVASGATAVVCTPGFVKTTIGIRDRDSGKSLPSMEYAQSAKDGAEVLEAAVAAKASALNGKMLQPYWIWEDLALALPVVPRAIQVLFHEVAMQKWTWGLHAHSTSGESYDRELQDKVWAWSEESTKE